MPSLRPPRSADRGDGECPGVVVRPDVHEARVAPPGRQRLSHLLVDESKLGVAIRVLFTVLRLARASWRKLCHRLMADGVAGRLTAIELHRSGQRVSILSTQRCSAPDSSYPTRAIKNILRGRSSDPIAIPKP